MGLPGASGTCGEGGWGFYGAAGADHEHPLPTCWVGGGHGECRDGQACWLRESIGDKGRCRNGRGRGGRLPASGKAAFKVWQCEDPGLSARGTGGTVDLRDVGRWRGARPGVWGEMDVVDGRACGGRPSGAVGVGSRRMRG